MVKRAKALEEMTCDELLRELAALAPKGDRLNEEIATTGQASPQQQPQVADLVDVRAQMDRITQLLREKGCTSE